MKDKLLDFFIKGLISKVESRHGRFNLAIDILLFIAAMLYSASDAIKNLMFTVADVVKSVQLNKDIHHPYPETSFFELMLPFLIVTFICFIYVSLHESKKQDYKVK